MPTQEITVRHMNTILREVVLVMLGGIRRAYPIATQYDTDSGIQTADENIHFYLGCAIKDFLNKEDPEVYELTLDAIRDEVTNLVWWYTNLKPNYQAR